MSRLRGWRRAGFALLMLALAGGLGSLRGLGHVDRVITDGFTALNGRPAPADLVIVAIDDRSLAAIGRWPWRRGVQADLLQRLSAGGPRAIGLDIVYSEADVEHPGDDRALAQAVRSSGRVVLPLRMAVADGGPAISLPVKPLAEAAAALAHIHVELDSDGIARRVFLREGPGRAAWPHFSLALLQVAGDPAAAAALPGERRPAGPAPADAWSRDHRWPIAYAGPPGHLRRVSALDVLTGQVPAATFHDAIVLVGATAAGLGDAYPTPVASQDALMAGVEISANALDALRRGLALQEAGAWQNALFNALPVALVLLAMARLRPRQVLLATGLALPALLLAGWAAQRLWQLQFMPLAGLLVLALLYPLWSWRRLDAALAYLADEFARTRVPAALSDPPVPLRGDPLDRHIASLAGAAEQLRQLQRQREQALQFLSHDIRSPLAAMLALIELQPAGAAAPDLLPRLAALAGRGLGLADGFVQLARAESAELRFEPLDLRDVLLDATDDTWAPAQAAGIALTSQVPDGDCEAVGHRSLLTRALVNLIGNALQHGARRVDVRLAAVAAGWALTVADDGPGIPLQAQSGLFDRFAQASVHGRGGVGLGLALVRAVAQRHHGQVELVSSPGQGAAFTLLLPAGTLSTIVNASPDVARRS